MSDFKHLKALFGVSDLCGIDVNLLQPWICKFGAIPKVLIDYYAQLGAHKYNRAQDYLLLPEEIEQFDNPDYLIFYSEHQQVSVWGIHKDDLLEDNPPVYENYGGVEWFKTTDTLTAFFNSMGLLQAVFAMEFNNEEFWEVDEDQAQEITKRFTSKNADSELYTGVRFYGNNEDSVIVVMNNNENYILMFSSSDESHFEEMYDIIKVILGEG